MVDGCRCCAIGYKAVDESTSGHVRYAMVATVLVPKVPKGIREPLAPMEEPQKMVDESMDWGGLR